MKITIEENGRKIGALEVSTMPAPAHKFTFNKKKYEILKVREDSIEVSERRDEIIIDETSSSSKPGD